MPGLSYFATFKSHKRGVGAKIEGILRGNGKVLKKLMAIVHEKPLLFVFRNRKF